MRSVASNGVLALLGTLALLLPVSAEAAFAYRKQVTVACAGIVTPPHANYPVLVSVVDPDLRNAPAGRVRSPNGYDIAFMDSNGAPLNHELEAYNPATGRLVAWVTLPTLGGACPTPTTFFMYYGDPEITCAQSRILGVPGTWDGSFRYILHMAQSGAANPVDSSLVPKTALRNPTADAGITNAYAPGVIGNAIDLITSPAAPPTFLATTPTHVRVNDGALTNNQGYTIEGWFFMRTLNPGWLGIVTKNRDGGFNDWAGLYKLSNGFAPPNPMGLGNNTGGDVAGTTSLAAGQWYYGAVSWDGTNRRVYRYDVNETTNAAAVTLTNVLNPSRIGDDSNGNYLDGLIDEVRFSDFARPPGWIRTSARNQGCPSATSPAPSCSLSFPASLQAPFATYGAEQPVPTNYRSIGGPGSYSTGTVTANGTAIITGTGTGWVAANRGRGDLITVNGNTRTVLSVDSPTQITVYGTMPASLPDVAYSISRMFTSLAAWEDCIDGTPVCPAGSPAAPSTNYITDDRREVGVVFKDVPVVGQVTFAPSLTLGPFHDVTLTADPGNRHGGRAGAAGAHAIIDNNTATPAIQTNAASVINHLTVEWLEIKNGNAGADGIEFNNTTTLFNKLVVRNCVIHNVGTDGIQVNGTANDGNGLFYNNVIYQTARDGIGLQIAAAANSSWLMYNNTIYNNARYGIFETVGAAAAPVFTLINNISIANTNNDYNMDAGDINASSSNNITGDIVPPAPGTSPLNNVPLTGVGGVNFVNTTLGSEDLHITTGSSPASVARDAGIFVCNVPRDIDGVVRLNPWEIGADDISQTTAVTLQSFTAACGQGAVTLAWETASELANLGFHVYRSASESGPWERMTAALMPGLGSSASGQSYRWIDSAVVTGRRYHYLLEDVESTGRTERHGPVSVMVEGDGEGGGGGSPGEGASGGASGVGTDSEAGTLHGEGGEPTLRELERGADYVVLELVTPGFRSVAGANGAQVTIAGFEEAEEAGSPAVPTKGALVPAVAGRRVRLLEIQAEDTLEVPGLALASQGSKTVVVSATGTVRAGRSRRVLGESAARGGLYPRSWATLEGVAFQGETKKARLILSPLRHDPRTKNTVLARRLVVRLEFFGVEARERSLGGAQGRQVRPARVKKQGVVAHLHTKEGGLHRVSFEEVLGSARKGVLVSRLRLSRRGEDAPFHVEPEKALFGPGSWLYFVAGGEESLDGERVYELRVGAAGVPMGVGSGAPSGASVIEYEVTRRYEENRFYQAGLLEAPDLWLWDLLLAPVSKSYSFTVSDLAASFRASRVRVVLQGASDLESELDHHVRVLVNGNVVGERSWDGKREEVIEGEVLPGILLEGTNTLTVENVGDVASSSMVFMNRFEVSHPRQLVAEGGRLLGVVAESGTAEIGGLTGPAFVVDVTQTPTWLKDVLPGSGGLRFRAESGRSYLAVGETSVLRPEVKAVVSNRLRTKQRADWVLLGPREFLPAAAPLVALRRSQGLRVVTVALEDVYQEFGEGEAGPQAIKSFLEYAYESWRRPSFRYVVLLGDSTYDPRDYLKTGVLDRLPFYPVKTSYLWTASDPAYGAVNGEDLLPDVAVGRLPAGSLEEARILVDKLVAYESAGRRFSGRAVLFADNEDLGGPFEADADEVASSVLQNREVRKIYLRDLGAGMRAEIVGAFDAGAGLMSYVGHGATAVWASENVFNNSDVTTLSPQAEQPLLLTLNCLNGFFHFPPFNSLSEALLKAEGKGALAAFSPSGLSLDAPAHLYHQALLQEIESGRHHRLGDALLSAQSAYADSGSFPELLAIYHLFGDPAQRLR